MKSNHDDDPMSETNMPSNPWRGVSVEHQRQKDQIGYHHNGADQYHHQANKHLTDKDRGADRERGSKENWLRIIK